MRMEMQSKKQKTELEKSIKAKEPKVFDYNYQLVDIKNVSCSYIKKLAIYSKILETRRLNE